MDVKQLKGNIRLSAEIWAREQFCVIRDKHFSKMFASPSMIETNLDLNGNWLWKYVSDALGRGSDCCVVKVVESGEVHVLVHSTVISSGQEEVKEELPENGKRFWFYL